MGRLLNVVVEITHSEHKDDRLKIENEKSLRKLKTVTDNLAFLSSEEKSKKTFRERMIESWRI